MDAADCAAAIEKMGRSDGARYGGRQFEFVGRSGVRKTPLPPMHTPRRYTAGTCTVVIAMLNIFPEADLPDPPKNPLGSSDVTTFHDLYLAADSVLHHCVAWLQQAGYQQEGVVASIGVLLLATDSLENHSIPPGVNPADILDTGEDQPLESSGLEEDQFELTAATRIVHLHASHMFSTAPTSLPQL
ncbi:MAG: hypothetical protein Q9185_002685 [Variospora sp. 1 TL-2023]